MTIQELTTEIITDLTTEMSSDPTFNADILAIKVKNAIREVSMKRNYTVTTWKEEQIASDLYNYYSTIEAVARYDYNMVGAEGESSHSENGISRQFVNRDELFKGVHAFVSVIL